MNAAVLLEVRGLSKSFGPVHANDNVSFSIRAGEVHALLGENGAGKSTLVKQLYGVYQPDSGEITLAGSPTRIDSPATARAQGIGLVFQDMRLIPALTVWENIALNLPSTKRQKPADIKAMIVEASAKWGLPVEPNALVADLSVGEWQRIELLKVLLAGANVLILDEPTSVLTPSEVGALFAVLTDLRAAGVGIVIITHKLREVREIADRVTVLRGGKTIVSDVPADTLTDPELIEAMVGRSVPALESSRTQFPPSLPAIELAAASLTRRDGTSALRSVSFRVHPGEILGIAGVAGNGQEELVDVLTGVRATEDGDVMLNDNVVPGGQPGGFKARGVISVVPDPVRQFVVPGMSIAQHAALWEVAHGEHTSYATKEAARRFTERAAAVGLPVAPSHRVLEELSGGNIQRVLLTLAFSTPGSVLVVSYPTRGLDVATTRDTRQRLLEARERGLAIVLVSEDLDELLEVSDRIAVLNEGSITGILDRSDADRAALGDLMTRLVEAA